MKKHMFHISNIKSKWRFVILFMIVFVITIFFLNFLNTKNDFKSEIKNEIKKIEEKQNIISSDKVEKQIEKVEKKNTIKKKPDESSQGNIIKRDKNQVIEKDNIAKNKTKKISDKIDYRDPKETINQLHEGISLGVLENFNNTKNIINLIRGTYDIEKMISMIVGSNWKKIEDAKRKRIKIAFEEYVAKNYIKRFKTVKTLEFKILEKKKVGEKYIMVKSKLIINQRDKINIDYLLALRKNNWKIFDVLLAESISEIATKKSEFNRFVKDGKIDSLIKALEEKNLKLIN